MFFERSVNLFLRVSAFLILGFLLDANLTNAASLRQSTPEKDIFANAAISPNGSVDSSFTANLFSSFLQGTRSSVSAIARQADGKILLAGNFNYVDGAAESLLVRLNADGSVDTRFNPPGLYPIQVIVPLADGKILVGGAFSNYNGAGTYRGLARLNEDGSIDDSFAVDTSNVSAVAVQPDGKIIIGGAFTQGNGFFQNALARINANGTIDNSFNYVLGFAAFANIVAVQADGKILAAGSFEYVNKTIRNGLVRLNFDGSVDESFKVTGNFSGNGFSSLTVIAPQADGKILIGGGFTIINGQPANRIARLKSDGSLDTDFNVGTGFNGNVVSIVVQADGKIFVSGNFTFYNGTARPGIARLNKDGSLDATFESPFTSGGFAGSAMAQQADGKILLAGNFTLTNGTQRRGVIRLNANGTLDDTFNTVLDSASIRQIVVQPDGKIIIAGSFSAVNGVARCNIARLNSDGSVDAVFSPRTGANNIINAVSLQADGKIWIGGDFTTFNGVRRIRLARLNPNGSLDDFNLNGGANAAVQTLAPLADGRLIVGGSFSQIGGLNRNGLARVGSPRSVFSPLNDFDGDGKTDFAVFRPASGAWYTLGSSNGNFEGRLFGLPTDKIVPADYDGDGKTDIAVWRPGSGQWFILKSATGEVFVQQFGASGDIPLGADYDGDGLADLAVYRPASGTWYILQSSQGFKSVQFGSAADVPVVADFDGDGRGDLAVYRPSNGTWYVLQSSQGFAAVSFGIGEDVPVAGDYDGDGKTDYAVFRPSNATWYLLRSAQGFSSLQFGTVADRPVPGDYDGDGKTDIGVFRPSNGFWYVALSSNNALKTQQFGASGDLPIPAAYLK